MLADISILTDVTEKEVAGITELLTQLYGKLEYNPTKTQIISCAAMNSVFVGRVGDKIVAMATLIIAHRLSKVAAHVEDVVVSAEYRGKGLGKALMERVVEHAKERGARTIDLETNVERKGARAFYRKIGFHHRKHMLVYRFS